MKANKRSQGKGTAPVSSNLSLARKRGNEGRFGVIEVNAAGRPEQYYLTVDGTPVPFPVAYVRRGNKLNLRCILPPGFLEAFQPDPVHYGQLSRHLFPCTTKAHELGRPGAELQVSFALEVANLTKDPAAIIDSIPTLRFEEMQTYIRNKSRYHKLDALDHLLLKNYQQKLWDKVKMAELGKICGKMLKRKPFPASTMKDRLKNLRLQSKIPRGAPESEAMNRAVAEYRKKKHGIS
jgi:hypothetical protein